MNAYIYQAALLCEECAHAASQQMKDQGTWDASRDDSDFRPVGPYPNGGGEADSPQHCDSCGLFLENPLTTDGHEYVRQEIAHLRRTQPNPEECAGLREWAPFYGLG